MPPTEKPPDAFPPVICTCGAVMALRWGEKYSSWFYGCSRFPECSTTHGCHQKTGEPLGFPADSETKRARIFGHAAFDRTLALTGLTRTQLYFVLSQRMRITKDECHFGAFDMEKCNRAIAELDQICLQFQASQGKRISKPPTGNPNFSRMATLTPEEQEKLREQRRQRKREKKAAKQARLIQQQQAARAKLSDYLESQLQAAYSVQVVDIDDLPEVPRKRRKKEPPPPEPVFDKQPERKIRFNRKS